MLNMFKTKETKMVKLPECGVAKVSILEGDMVRFLREGTFFGKPSHTVAEERGWRITEETTDSFTASVQVLIPASEVETYPYIQEMDRFLNEVEEQMSLCAKGDGACTSSTWWVGHDGTDHDTIFLDIPLKEGLEARRLLNIEAPDYNELGIRRYRTVNSWTVPIEGSLEADLKLCSSANGEPLWTEMVLFDAGCEVCCSDVAEDICGEWAMLDIDKDPFVVCVRLGTEEEWNARKE